MKLNQIAFVLVATLGVVGATHAGVEGKSSNEDNIVVQETGSLGPNHPDSGVGFGIKTLYNGAIVAFSGFSGYADTNDVVVLTPHLAGLPPSHAGIGYVNYKQVPNNDVWFGEWYAAGTGDSSTNHVLDETTHTVYYNGKDADTSITSTATAYYDVEGISNYAANGLLAGTFKATFGTTNELTGDVSNSSGYKVDIGTASINSDATISGSNAVASQSGTNLATNGTVLGQFYNSQAALAGYVTFDVLNSQYDTAFGGVRQ